MSQIYQMNVGAPTREQYLNLVETIARYFIMPDVLADIKKRRTDPDDVCNCGYKKYRGDYCEVESPSFKTCPNRNATVYSTVMDYADLYSQLNDPTATEQDRYNVFEEFILDADLDLEDFDIDIMMELFQEHWDETCKECSNTNCYYDKDDSPEEYNCIYNANNLRETGDIYGYCWKCCDCKNCEDMQEKRCLDCEELNAECKCKK